MDRKFKFSFPERNVQDSIVFSMVSEFKIEPSILRAAIDDGLLNVEFQVKSFRVDIFDSMGNDIPEDSQTSEWSSRQLEALRRLSRGKTFFITRVKAVGPDGIERTLSPIQVIL